MAKALIKRIFPALLRSRREKGIAILLVLAMIFFILILAHIILSIITSEFRLVQHNISRTQAYYSAMAGIHYAYNRLTVGGDPMWPMPTPAYVRYLCEIGSSSCPGTAANGINEPGLPETVDFVAIGVASDGAFASASITNTPPIPPAVGIPGCDPCSHVSSFPYTCICARASYRD